MWPQFIIGFDAFFYLLIGLLKPQGAALKVELCFNAPWLFYLLFPVDIYRYEA